MTYKELEEEIVRDFRNEYRKTYKDILPDEILVDGNTWFELFIRSALRRVAEEAVKACDERVRDEMERIERAIGMTVIKFGSDREELKYIIEVLSKTNTDKHNI